jgi:curved DNA-binding protein
MKFTDYYQVLGLQRGASQDEIKQAYRKLARKYHPDVSKESDAEARFKEVGEAYEVLKDPEKRAAYDRVGQGARHGQDFQPPPDWDSGFNFGQRGANAWGGEQQGGERSYFGADPSEFFEAMFGEQARQARAGRRGAQAGQRRGQDQHTRILIDLEDAYRGARRSVSLRFPVVDDEGNVTHGERTLEISIPKGIREGQHLRLVGQGEPGPAGQAGDLYLEIGLKPHPRYRIDGVDVYMDLPVAPWEAALGAQVTVPTPDGSLQLNIPKASQAGRKLRLKGKGIPSKTPGDLYVVLRIALPPADTEAALESYRAMARSFNFNPRAEMEGASS